MKEIGVRVEDEPEWVGPDPLLQMAAKGHRMVPATVVAEAVAAERARIKAAVLTLPTLDLPTGEYVALESVLDEIDEVTP